MSCNCNQADPNCEPCSQCTPPGVLCLPDCNPKQFCDDTLDLCCVKYSGSDQTCNNIKKGDSFCTLFLDKIFPKAYLGASCCELEISIDLLPNS